MGTEITVPMPRLTNADYYQRYRFIRHIWRHYQNLFALIPIDQQYDLHNFYQPDRDLTKAELITYRKDIKHEDPGLPARASRAYVQLRQAYENVIENDKHKETQKHYTPPPRPRKLRNLKSVSVRSVVRPEPDWDKLAFALLQQAGMTQAERKQKKGNRPLPQVVVDPPPSSPLPQPDRGTAESNQLSLDL